MTQIPNLPINFQILSQINEDTNPTLWLQNEQNQQFILKVLPNEVKAQKEFAILKFLEWKIYERFLGFIEIIRIFGKK